MRTPAQRHYPTMRQATQHRQWTSYRTAGSLKKCMARAHHQIPPARQHQTARPPTNTNRRKAGPEVKKPEQPSQQTQKGIEPDWKQEPRPRMQPFFSCRTRVPNFRKIKKKQDAVGRRIKDASFVNLDTPKNIVARVKSKTAFSNH